MLIGEAREISVRQHIKTYQALGFPLGLKLNICVCIKSSLKTVLNFILIREI